MLVTHARLSPDDLRAWAQAESWDARLATTRAFARRVSAATATLRAFVARGGGYCAVSWGKDSVVVADLVQRVAPAMPVVWVRVEPICNPDCLLVRDAFLRRHPTAVYDEITVHCRHDADGWHATGTLERGFATAAARYGDRYVSGIRAEESGPRTRRMRTHGASTARTCAPIGWWRGADVFAYLYARGLPVHPAYAATFGGGLDRTRIRVASLGGQRGSGRGRAAWEWHYYRAEIEANRLDTTNLPW